MRIGRVLGYREGSAASRGTAAAVLVVLLMMCGVVLDRRAHAEKAQAAQVIPAVMTGLSAPAVEHDSAPDEPKAALQRVQRQAGGQDALPDSVSPLYRNWLNQDVVWIITPEERHAFVSLGNDAERDDFIRSFWLRRDGAGGPDSAREEHYARIAYTNQRFGAGEDHPGWKSDRGHAYIAYGRPETVESHPSGGVAPNGKQIAYPFEVWRYASIPGRGQNVQMMFVDPCGCGQYNYTVDGDTRAERRGTLPATPAAKLLPVSSQSSDTTDQPAGARVRVAAGVIAGALVAHPNPVYPAAAKAAGIQGTVVLHALIEKDGTISKVEPISGPAELIDGAVDAVQQWVYRPYLLNGNPVAVDTTIRVNFSLAPLRVPAGALAGNAVSQTAPVYPPDAKANRIQGTVVLKARIGKTGEVSDLQVVNGPEELRQSAIDAVSRWVYKPYLLNGQPTEVETTINVNFTLGQ
jgi:TonB family protein